MTVKLSVLSKTARNKRRKTHDRPKRKLVLHAVAHAPVQVAESRSNNYHQATTRSPVWTTSDSRARRTASAMASLVRAPRHSSMMASQSIPSPTYARTSATRILVPRKTGLLRKHTRTAYRLREPGSIRDSARAFAFPPSYQGMLDIVAVLRHFILRQNPPVR